MEAGGIGGRWREDTLRVQMQVGRWRVVGIAASERRQRGRGGGGGGGGRGGGGSSGRGGESARLSTAGDCRRRTVHIVHITLHIANIMPFFVFFFLVLLTTSAAVTTTARIISLHIVMVL